MLVRSFEHRFLEYHEALGTIKPTTPSGFDSFLYFHKSGFTTFLK